MIQRSSSHPDKFLFSMSQPVKDSIQVWDQMNRDAQKGKSPLKLSHMHGTPNNKFDNDNKFNNDLFADMLSRLEIQDRRPISPIQVNS